MNRQSEEQHRQRVRGCLLDGAIGDALGAGIEFLTIARIRSQFGPSGVTGHTGAFGHTAPITDDTQMTLFTAEGLICAAVAGEPGGIAHVYRAYLRWLSTQRAGAAVPNTDGWLLELPQIHSRRAPGNTCLSALASGTAGSTEHRINDSKGCGGVMRAAPCGLVGGDAFRLGCDSAALTHGHPSGWLAAGGLALMIQVLAAGHTLEEAADAALDRISSHPEGRECAGALRAAVREAGSAGACPEAVESLGGGWVAEEALAIAVFCALKAQDFAHGVLLAVNHSGDSDSTGAITGNILGTLLGFEALPEALLAPLELRAEIDQIARDLYAIAASASTDDGLRDRYL
jgi:ADP-ribosylglycohydrolase